MRIYCTALQPREMGEQSCRVPGRIALGLESNRKTEKPQTGVKHSASSASVTIFQDV